MNRWRLAGWLAVALVIAGAAYSTADSARQLAANRAAQIEVISYD